MPDDDLKSWSKNALIHEVRRLRHVSSQVLSRTGTEPLMFESGVTLHGKPFVRMWWGEESGQISPEAAYEHAQQVIEVAAAAHFDASLFRLWTGPKMEMEPEQVMAMLVDLRNYRGGSGAESQSGSMTTPLRPTVRDHPTREDE